MNDNIENIDNIINRVNIFYEFNDDTIYYYHSDYDLEELI